MSDAPEEAYVCENQLYGEVPSECLEDIQARKGLRKLSFKNNELAALPAALFQLPQLQSLYYLNLSHNRFTEVPAAVLGLKSLEILDLSHNQLSALPPTMGGLANLKVLSLNSNNLQMLPPQIADLPNLVILELENNPLRLPAKLSPYADDEHWLERARAFIRQHPQEFLQKPFPFHASAGAGAPSASSGERLRSVSESGVNLRAARRMGFVMQRNAPGASIVANLHGRGGSAESVAEGLEHRRSASATLGSTSHPHPHVHASTTLAAPEERRSPFASPRGSPRPSTTEEPRLGPLQEATPEETGRELDFSEPAAAPDVESKTAPPLQQLRAHTLPQLSAPPQVLVGVQGAQGVQGTQGTQSLPQLQPLATPQPPAAAAAALRAPSVASIQPAMSSQPPSQAIAAPATIQLPPLQTQMTSQFDPNCSPQYSLVQSIRDCLDLFHAELGRLSVPTQKPRRSDDAVAQLAGAQAVIEQMIGLADRLDRRQHRELAAFVVRLLPELENTWRESQKSRLSPADLPECMLDEQLRVQLRAASSKTNKVIGLLNRLISSLALQSTDDPALAALIASRVRELSNVCIRCTVSTRQLAELLDVPVAASGGGRRFYDEVNLFLRAVISVLSAIKAALPDIPQLAEGVVGPEVAALTRVVKEIPPLLEQSSYRYILDYPDSGANLSLNMGMNATPSLGTVGAGASATASAAGVSVAQPTAPTPMQASLGQAAKILVSPTDRQERPNQGFFDSIVK